MLLIPAQTIARGWREAGADEDDDSHGGSERAPQRPPARRGRPSRRPSSSGRADDGGERASGQRCADDDAWPRTRRPLPWLFAGFLATIFLVPFDAIHLKVSLPFSSDFDRFFVA